jgi:hypothetical protein
LSIKINIVIFVFVIKKLSSMFTFDVLEIEGVSEISFKEKKTLNPITKNNRADIFCDYSNSNDKEVYPNLCGTSVRNSKYKKPINSFGFLSYEQNPVRGNGEAVYIQSGVGHRNRGVYINDSNIMDVFSVFTAKRVVKGNFINWYDEYVAPNKNEEYLKFKYDSIVYSLFSIKSFQSSLRNIEYEGQIWNIKNEFFWVSADRMKELADENGYDELYNDARTASDRHVYKLLFGEERIYDKLSDDAKAVLDKATDLVERSMELRQVMANDENHLNSWDAGYAQLKLVWKEYFEEDFKEFRQLYKKMEDRMRPLVYELGFLMK